MRNSSLNNINFIQLDSKVSFRIIRYEDVV